MSLQILEIVVIDAHGVDGASAEADQSGVERQRHTFGQRAAGIDHIELLAASSSM